MPAPLVRGECQPAHSDLYGVTSSPDPGLAVDTGEKTMKSILLAAAVLVFSAASGLANTPRDAPVPNPTMSMQAFLEAHGINPRTFNAFLTSPVVPGPSAPMGSGPVPSPWSSPFTWNPNIGGGGG
ncbi:MAG: hypothetical protein ABI369_07865 [Acetobacteraceae bacterium]